VAGLYIHIPFCKTRCAYCDFFSSENKNRKDEYVDSVCGELVARHNYLHGQTVDTVYFGGGTPSQLAASHFEKIFNNIFNTFKLTSGAEITLEANPDDCTAEYLHTIRHLPFSRISLGVQSFDDADLVMLNRRHDAATALKAIERFNTFGYGNISIDLMFGLPGQTSSRWEATLHRALSLNVRHISAYHLTYEKGTILYNKLKKGIIHAVEEETSLQQFDILIDLLSASGFEHYEISNFALEGYRSRHNSSYWNGTHYLGAGASAHSYDGFSRQWNISSISGYISGNPAEAEIIDKKTSFNEFIITRLRTSDGVNLSELLTLFGQETQDRIIINAQRYIDSGHLCKTGNRLHLNRSGIFISDAIIRDLMKT
jgi:oxygen-independent coproporphyrinogen-3 oxidase